MDRLCQICGLPLCGRQRKYCSECKHKAHLQQMNNYYDNNKSEWLDKDGKYVRDDQTCVGRVSGEDHWNYGRHLLDEHKKKISNYHKGKHHTNESKQKMKDNHWDVSGKNNPMFGKFGEKCPNWKGGFDKSRPYLTPELQCTKLNKRFKDCEGHHIMKSVIIYVPRDIHRSIWHSLKSGKNMEKINGLAFNYLMGNY